MGDSAGITTYPIEQCDAVCWTFNAGERIVRTSTAIAIGGGCLLVDPVDGDGLDQAIEPLGAVIGVCTLLDRHRRDATRLADRYTCPHLVPSTLAGSGEPLVIDGIQERAILAAPGWNESALWLPERGLLVSADALGTTPYFLADGGESIGIHPVLRLRPPVGAFRGLAPTAIAVGHGAPVTAGATDALAHAVDTARSGLPKAWWRVARAAVGRR